MRNTWRLSLTVMALGAAAFLVFVLFGLGAFEFEPHNPFEKNGICFVRSMPGATSRFVQYAPVTCNDPNIPIADPVGADYAELRFEDVDNDGTAEGIVESSSFRCRYGAGPCYDAYRIIMKICLSCTPKVTVVDKTYLKDLTQSP